MWLRIRNVRAVPQSAERDATMVLHFQRHSSALVLASSASHVRAVVRNARPERPGPRPTGVATAVSRVLTSCDSTYGVSVPYFTVCVYV